jgi:hypothetical protein
MKQTVALTKFGMWSNILNGSNPARFDAKGGYGNTTCSPPSVDLNVIGYGRTNCGECGHSGCGGGNCKLPEKPR